MTNKIKPGFNVNICANGYFFTWVEIYNKYDASSIILTEEFVAKAVEEKIYRERAMYENGERR